MNRRRALSLCAALALVSVEVAGACTTFCASATDAVLFGRNYDFEIGDGALMVNPRGLAKHALAARGPAWTASYGSLTFNQFGRDFPTGGMNEKGLVVELMWLSDTEYPPADSRPELGVLEWIQYQLDTAGSVADVLASDRAVRIAGEVPLHYLVSDASGTSAAVEFLRGRRQVRTGKDLPIAALANSTYDSSLSYLRSHARPPGGS